MKFLEQLSKKNDNIGEFDPKLYDSNDYKINSEQLVGVPQNDNGITILPGGVNRPLLTLYEKKLLYSIS